MSSFVSQARARALRPVEAFVRPRLTIVPRAPVRAPRVPFVLLVVTVLTLGLVGLLLLNTALQRGAYRATDLRNQSAELAIRQQNLEQRVASLQEPQRLLEQSARLGMVVNDNPAFISLANGAILGKPVAATATGRVDVRQGIPGGSRQNTKISQRLSGTGASLGSGAVTIDAPRPTGAERPRDKRGRQ